MTKKKETVDYKTIAETLKNELQKAVDDYGSLRNSYDTEVRKTTLQSERIKTLETKVAELEAKSTQNQIKADEATAKCSTAESTQRYLEGVIKGKDDMIAGLKDIIKDLSNKGLAYERNISNMSI